MKHSQLDLFPEEEGNTLESIVFFLNENAPDPVSVVLTRNRVSMISVEFTRKVVKVRMHMGFLVAPWIVIQSLRRYLRTKRRADWNIVSEFASGISASPHESERKDELNSKGAVYDLKEIYRIVNKEFFSGRIKCNIGWSRGRAKRRRRLFAGKYIRFGSWVESTRTVKVHPALDSHDVPIEFVKYIVFHEMLHAVVPKEVRNGRSYDHSSQFRKLERAYPEFNKMKHLSRHILNKVV